MSVLFGYIFRLVFVLVLLSPENDFLGERHKQLSILAKRLPSYLLFEITSLFFIDENQIEKISHGEFPLDVLHRRRQFITTEEQTDRNALTWKASTVHLSLARSLVHPYLGPVHHP